jgi:cobalt/nickel transport system permease protein
MITALLVAIFSWYLLYGRIPNVPLLFLCIMAGGFFIFAGRHKHLPFLSIDLLALKSPLKHINPVLKCLILFLLMIICITSKGIYTGLFLVIVMALGAVWGGQMKLQQYVQILVLPISFLLIGGLTLLFEISVAPIGIVNVRFFQFFLCVTETAQMHTAMVIFHALGAVSCLCLLSVTTPLSDLIAVLHRIRCPDLIIDLMYLIYRYIFILFSIHHDMNHAAKSRLGFSNYQTGIRTAGKIYASLLVRSYRFALQNFDAMESRCYLAGIRFIDSNPAITLRQVCICVILLLISLSLSLC